MYAAIAFDTHNYIKEIVKTGITEPQAEAIAKFVSDSRNYDFSRLATKEQVENLRSETKADISRLEQRIEHIEEKMATKEDLARLETQFISAFKGLEVQIAKQDSQQKTRMIGIFLSIVTTAVTLFLKLQLA